MKKNFTVIRTVTEKWHVQAPSAEAAAFKVHDGLADHAGVDHVHYVVELGHLPAKHPDMDDTAMGIDLNDPKWQAVQDEIYAQPEDDGDHD